MKVNLKNIVGLSALGMTLFVNTAPTWAGAVGYSEVVIHPTTSYPNETQVSGSLVGARYSGDSQQFIGCRFSHTFGPYVVCEARDNTGKSLLCTSNEPRYLGAAEAITDFSYISFSVTPGSTSCTYLQVQNYSQYVR